MDAMPIQRGRKRRWRNRRAPDGWRPPAGRTDVVGLRLSIVVAPRQYIEGTVIDKRGGGQESVRLTVRVDRVAPSPRLDAHTYRADMVGVPVDRHFDFVDPDGLLGEGG